MSFCTLSDYLIPVEITAKPLECNNLCIFEHLLQHDWHLWSIRDVEFIHSFIQNVNTLNLFTFIIFFFQNFQENLLHRGQQQ